MNITNWYVTRNAQKTLTPPNIGFIKVKLVKIENMKILKIFLFYRK